MMNFDDLIQRIEQKTGLKLQEENSGGNLCFRYNNQNLRNEFKEVFTIEDLNFYIRYFDRNEVQLPIDNIDFWNKVELGCEKSV